MANTEKRYRKINTFILIVILLMAGGMLLKSDLVFPMVERIVTRGEHRIPAQEEWYLIVVNPWNRIPEDYSVSLTELSNGKKIDSRIYPALQEMFDAMRADGIYPVVGEGYRTRAEQQQMMDDKISSFILQGYSQKDAKQLAKELVAEPGTSEHELGIAVDINADHLMSENEEVYAWLADYAYQYGFILRYPQYKYSVTGFDYEPWHYRYVGKETALAIYTQQITLEEYLRQSGT